MTLLSPLISRRSVHRITIHDDGETCVLDFGDCTITIKGPRLGNDPRTHFDFVLLLAAAVGMTRGRRFEIEAPVTREAVHALNKFLFVWRCWRTRGIRPTDVIPLNIIEPEARARSGGVVTLSGGVDSTYAVMRARREFGLEHALLVAGADYPSSEHPGFKELHERVRGITDALNVTLHVVETDARRVISDWVSHHIAVLTSILKLVGGGLDWAGYAADVTVWGELTYAPGSNMAGFAEIIGTRDHPFRYFGGSESRAMKLRQIAEEAPSLFRHISVCWKDTSIGGNCGACEKCIRTRLALEAAGVGQAAIFDNEIDLVEALAKAPVPWRRAGGIQLLRLDYYSLEELPAGELRSALQKRMKRVARRHDLYLGSDTD